MKYIIKGILLHITIISSLLFIMGCESLIDSNQWLIIIVWFLSNFILFFSCYSQITYKELYKISGEELLDKIFK
jgi:hypothetical protein